MAFTYIDTVAFANPSDDNSVSLAVTAQIGDLLTFAITYRKNTGGVVSNVMWDGQPLAAYGTAIDDGEALTVTYWSQAASSATANLTADISQFVLYTAVARVDRPPASAIVTLGDLPSPQIYTSGTDAHPSLNVSSVPAGAVVISHLKYMLWDSGYGNVSPVFTESSPLSDSDGAVNTNYRGVGGLVVAGALAATGTVTAAWTQDVANPNPQYAHRAAAFHAAAAPSTSIDTVTTDGNSGFVVGEPFTYTETGLGTVTGFTVTTAATPAATTDAINLTAGAGEMKYWVDGEYYPFAGTVIAEATDGAETGSGSFTLSIPADQVAVVFNAVETTDNTYLGNKLLAIGHPLANDDIGYYPPADGLTIGTNSSVSSLIGATTFILWVHKTSGIIERYDVTVNDAGEITGLVKPNRLWIGVGFGI
jgi:hypothetical protein